MFSNTDIVSVFFDNLSEKDRRMYATVEVSKLNHGGLKYICLLLGCSDNTVYQGKKDLLEGDIQKGRIRKPGGGRKTAHEIFPLLNDVFLNVLKDRTAGDPMDDKAQWTDLSNKEIRIQMEKDGIKISKKIVAKVKFSRNTPYVRKPSGRSRKLTSISLYDRRLSRYQDNCAQWHGILRSARKSIGFLGE